MDWTGIRVLVTGSSGFVGTHLIRELEDKGAVIFGFDIKEHLVKEFDDKSFTFLQGYLEDFDSIASAVQYAEPEIIFHLGAISHIHYSFNNPNETMRTNVIGTSNVLESIRKQDLNTKIVFAGSSDEYGLVFSSKEQYDVLKSRYNSIFPEPDTIPELPITENTPLRPMSPYAASKVAGDVITQTYWKAYGIRGIVSRAFSHEGPGRGINFMSSSIVSQVKSIKKKTSKTIKLGNVTAMRDWSWIGDVIDGYLCLAEKGEPGEVYNQGSNRTNSVLTFLLWALELSGIKIDSLQSKIKDTFVSNPSASEDREYFGLAFEKSRVDSMILDGDLNFGLEDEALLLKSSDEEIVVEFAKDLFRPADVPILLCDSSKIKSLGASYDTDLKTIIKRMLDKEI